MSDRATATEPTTRQTPNPHDTAMAVFRPEVYGEAADWLEQMNPAMFKMDAAFRVAVGKLRARQKETANAPGGGMLDHASAAYARHFADSIERAGYTGAAKLLRHTADALDGGVQ